MKWNKMNKKGQVDFIGNLLTTIPKPILFLFFILLLSFITLLLSPVFNSFGVFCDSEGSVVRLPAFNIVSNVRLMSSLPDADEIAGDSLDPNGFVVKCTEFVNGSERFLDFGCSSCVVFDDYVSQVDSSADVCVGDAFRIPSENLNWWKRTISCPLDDCLIPDNYYFEFDSSDFRCAGDCSSQNLADSRDKKLRELGSMPYYPSELNDNSFEGFFVFGCTDGLRVEPTIKGIPIFRLSYWAIIILIIILLWAVMRFGVKNNNGT